MLTYDNFTESEFDQVLQRELRKKTQLTRIFHAPRTHSQNYLVF